MGRKPQKSYPNPPKQAKIRLFGGFDEIGTGKTDKKIKFLNSFLDKIWL